MRELVSKRILTIFLWEKYRLNERIGIEFIQNKIGKRRVKIKKNKKMKKL